MDHQETSPAESLHSPALALLKRLRTRLTQTEISRRTGIPQPTLSRWESSGVAEAADDALKLIQLERELVAGESRAAAAANADAVAAVANTK